MKQPRFAAARFSNGPFANVAAGTMCLANKVSTYLQDLGKIRAQGGDFSQIDSFELARCVVGDRLPKRVHNLEVADASTYFAGDFDAWGHNHKRKYAAPCVRCKTRKEAYDRAKKAGGGKEPILHYKDPKGPHYHPNVPNSCSTSGKQPNSHWHFFFPKGR